MKKLVLLIVFLAIISCKENKESRLPKTQVTVENQNDMENNLNKYVSF